MEKEKVKGRRNPVESMNFVSSLFFGWLMPILRKGVKGELKITDLYEPLKPDESERLGDRLEREWEKELGKKGREKKPNDPKLLLALIRMFWAPCMLLGLLTLFQVLILRLAQPVLQGLIISYFYPVETQVTRNDALLYAGLLLIDNLGLIFVYHHVILRARRMGMCARIACCSLIYRKVLKLDLTTVHRTAAGQVANLISNDVARFDELFTFLHYIWITPLQVSLAGYAMWKSIGMATLVGIGSILIQSTFAQGYLSILRSKLRSKIAVKTDERVQLMSELVSAMQVVKMYCWEEPFALLVSKMREQEMKIISWAAFQIALHISMQILPDKVTLYLTLVTFVLMGNSLTAETTFVVASFFQALRFSCASFLPLALISTGEADASLKRITRFLLLDEVKRSVMATQNSDGGLRNGPMKREAGIEMVDVAANWVHGQLPPTLCRVSMEVKSGSLCAVVGPVGSGKSSLLHLLLGELSVQAGNLALISDEARGSQTSTKDIRVSYASQDPWLFSASIRENILFGQPYNEKRYRKVTRVCALVEDFEELPQGDLSHVGERGASLSGGQRARVNLARAVYRDADLYLLDDPLSAVDPRVARHLFEECITRFLKNKTRILVTHQLQYLRKADSVVVLNKGTVERQGTYEELVKSECHLLDYQEPGSLEHGESNSDAPDSKIVDFEYNDKKEPKDFPSGGEPEDVIAEEKAVGNIGINIYWNYFRAGNNFCSLTILTTVIVGVTVLISASDYWVAYWTNQETLRTVLESNELSEDNVTLCHGSGNDDSKIFSSLFDACGLLLSNSGIYVYTVLIAGCVLLNTLQCTMFMKTCMNSSRKIHDSMFANLLKAPMRFFNINPSGRILNRFSKDVGTMDELIPKAMLDTMMAFKNMFAIIGMVIMVNYWMAIPTIVLGVIFYMMCNCFLTTARDVTRLEAIAKSPVFSHISLTLDGLTTIRSRGNEAEQLLKREFDRHQDEHTGAWYLVIATVGVFGFYVDLISSAFIGCVCFSLILLDDGDTLPGFAGFAITQSLMLTGSIQFGFKQYTTVMSSMTSVERILQYTNLPTERSPTSGNPPPPTWPHCGGLMMKNVAMRYASNKPPTLKNINVEISPGWKVGVVGRTGAGKSSLISALFRLAGEGLEGEIVLDGVETGSIGLHELRPRISIIPQEPILFSATLRYNLDPFHEYDDHRLWDALREVELGHVLTCLDAPVAAAGANFSVGQRQLICLARAILRNNRILVLDEATANIDQRTDALIQKTIRKRFADCTVLTIAHRLNTIMDSDRVLVMAGGEIVEFGHPHLLLQNRVGHFSQMLQQTGNSMAETLARIARDAYLLNPEFMEHQLEQLTPSFTEQHTPL